MIQSPKYDLEERTTLLAEQVIDMVRSIKQDAVNKRIIEQLVGSSGSIGANYHEATEGESKKDFAHKIGIAKKEAKETNHWLRLLLKSNPECADKIQTLNKETHELVLIFSKIISSCRKND